MAARTLSSSATSMATAVAAPPASWMAATVAAPSMTSATTTLAPSRANSSAATRPSPAADPVISAVRPARRPLTESELDRHRAGAAHLAAGPRHLGAVDEPELGDPLQPLLDGDAHLH